MIIKSKQRRADVHDVTEIYTVDEQTMNRFDYKRKCWFCNKPLAIGDVVVVMFQEQGKNLLATRKCAEANDILVKPSPNQKEAENS
jgi:hypothetical protein